MKRCAKGFLLSLVLIIGFTTHSQGADLIKILPVTEKIIMLHFDEGHIDYQGYGQDRYEDISLYYNFVVFF